MNEDNKGGGSTVATIDDGFGFNGGTTKAQSPTAVPPKAEEPTPQKEDGKVSDVPKEEVEKSKEVEKKVEEKTFEKKAEEKHTLVIDLLDEKFQQLKAGKMTDLELKEWFGKHPELAETAGRSKRLKEDYRTLMEKEIPTEVVDDKSPAKAAKQDKDEADKPLTLKDLQRYDDEREAKLLSKTVQRERENQLVDFAVKHKVLDKDVDSLKRNAEALFRVNPEWDYSEAVQSAYNALNPRKSSPTNINIASGSSKTADQVATKFDAARGEQLLSASEFSGGQLK